jgi:hypothetical protein
MKSLPLIVAACAAVALTTSTPLSAADWASNVVSYASGDTYDPPVDSTVPFVPPAGKVNPSYTSPTALILDGITADTGGAVLTAFNGAWSPSHILGIGQGGSIVLQFTEPVRTSGYTVGIHTAAALNDFDFPYGYAGATAFPYTTPRQATIAVSAANNNDWVTLGTFNLDNPSNFYATGVDTPCYQPSVTGGTAADVTKPFLGNVSSFSGKNWPQVLATLDGSAGGNWIDLSSAGVPAINYIRFTVPTGSILYLDGVVGLPVPEPASIAVLGLSAALLRRRRRSA